MFGGWGVVVVSYFLSCPCSSPTRRKNQQSPASLGGLLEPAYATLGLREGLRCSGIEGEYDG